MNRTRGDAVGSVSGVVIDAGGLIAWERANRQMLALASIATQRGLTLIIPATALAQVLRDPARQARLNRLLRHPLAQIAPLDRRDATSVGVLLGVSGKHHVVDAHVVVCARRSGAAVVTSDPDDLRALDPDLTLIPL